MNMIHDTDSSGFDPEAALAFLQVLVLGFDASGICRSAVASATLSPDVDAAALIGQRLETLIAHADDAAAAAWQADLAGSGIVSGRPVRLNSGGKALHMIADARAELPRSETGGSRKKTPQPDPHDQTLLVVLRAETAAEATQREQFFLAEIARRTSNIVAMTDPDRRLVWVNDAFERRTGYSLDEARGRRPADLVQFEGTDPDTVSRITAAVRRNEHVRAEILNRSKTGQEYWLLLDIQPLWKPDGVLAGYMGVQTDITALKALTERAERASRRAEQRAVEFARARRRGIEAINVLPQGFALYDSNDRLLACNANFRKLVRGAAQRIVPGASYAEVMTEIAETGGFLETEAERTAWIAGKLAGARMSSQEFTYRKADTGQWVQAIDQRTPEGGLVSMRIDITALKAAEARMSSIIEGAGVGTWMWSRASDHNEINELWAGMLGYRQEELGTLDYDSLVGMIHPDDRAATLATWEPVIAGDCDQFETVFRMQHKAGHWVSILSRGRVLSRAADGSPEYLSGVHIDITEHKAREDALKAALRERDEAERRYYDVAAVSDDWFWEQDEELRYTWYSDSFTRITGAAPGFFLGKTREEWSMSDPRSRTAADWDWLHARIAAREPFSNFQYPVYLDDSGRATWLRASGAPVFDADGQFRGYRGVGSDVTALIEARERAEEASRAKSLFLANMSHEIRTPLNGVLGMAELLENRIADPEKLRMIGTIRESGESLLAILNDLLDMSKIEAGRLDLETLAFRPADLAEKVETLHAHKAQEKGLHFEILTGGRARGHRLGDPGRVRQILNNLISNAIKFTERGEVVAMITARPNGPVTIEVRDTGIGMDEMQTTRLFRDFVQADASISRRFGGTGLGLAIVRRLVDMMGGRIVVDSTPGIGTRIIVDLPLPETVAPAAPVVMPQPPARRLQGMRVLAADDNRTNRILLHEMLSARGAEVTLVENGAEAVAAWEPDRFDVLVLDIAMPVMGGIEALTRIREKAALAGVGRVPAIAFTANAMAHQVVEYVAAGFDSHVAKPFRADDLARAIEILGAAQRH